MGKNLVFILMLTPIVSCGGKKEGHSGNTPSPPSKDGEQAMGLIGGKPWGFKKAWVQKIHQSKDRYRFILSERDVNDPCSDFGGRAGTGSRELHFSSPAVVGIQNRSLNSGESFTMVTFDAEETRNYISFGSLEIKKVERDRIDGVVEARGDENNVVAGIFSAKRCSDPFGKPEDDFVAETSLDSLFVGRWDGIMTRFDWKTSLAIRSDGTLIATLKTRDDQLLQDGDQKILIDRGTTPYRMIFETTDVRTNLNGLLKKGDKDYCIFDILNQSKMKLECGKSQFPTKLPERDDDFDFIYSKM